MTEIKENWEKMAEAYDHFVAPDDSFSNAIELPCMVSMMGPIRDKKILEMGCGSGRVAFELSKQKPSHIEAVDISEEMIGLGKKYNEIAHHPITFHCSSIDQLDFIEDESKDVVVASTVLHFVENLTPVISEAYRVLKKGGEAVISLIHPVHSALYPVEKPQGELPKKEDYKLKYLYRENRAYVQPWIAMNPEIDNFLCYSFHHTLEDYMTAFLSVGFQLEALKEPKPPQSWQETEPAKYHAYMKAPNYLVLKLRK